MGQLSNSFPKHFSYLCEYAFRFDLSCSFCEYPFIFHCLHCSPSCFDPDSLLLAYYWLGLSWIGCISSKQKLFISKNKQQETLHQQQAAGEAKHSAETTINLSPLEGRGPHTRPRPTMIRGAGPDHLWDAAAEEWLQAAPEPQVGWSGDVSPLIREPLPPRIVLHTANVLRATEIHTWGGDVATIRWLPREGGAARLTVGHFNNGGPVYNEALSRLGDILGPPLLMLPTDLAAVLRQELDSCEGLRVGWEAVADSNLLAFLNRDTEDECEWGALVLHLTGRHTYMATLPRGHPRPACDDLVAAFHDHGILPNDTWQELRQKMLGRDHRRCVRARLLELRDPLRQRWDDLRLRRLGPWSPPSHTPATSAENTTRYPLQRGRAPTGAGSDPTWPRAPGLNLRRTVGDTAYPGFRDRIALLLVGLYCCLWV